MALGIGAEILATGVVAPGTGSGGPAISTRNLAVGGGSLETSNRVLATAVRASVTNEGLESSIGDLCGALIVGLPLDSP